MSTVPAVTLTHSRISMHSEGWLIAYACGACGFVELYAEGGGFVPPAP